MCCLVGLVVIFVCVVGEGEMKLGLLVFWVGVDGGLIVWE